MRTLSCLLLIMFITSTSGYDDAKAEVLKWTMWLGFVVGSMLVVLCPLVTLICCVYFFLIKPARERDERTRRQNLEIGAPYTAVTSYSNPDYPKEAITYISLRVGAMRLFVPCLVLASALFFCGALGEAEADAVIPSEREVEKRGILLLRDNESQLGKREASFDHVAPLLSNEEAQKPISRAKRGEKKEALKKGAKIALWLLLVIIIVPSLLCICCIAGVTYFFCCRE
ncbi:hypothetical protein QR680_005770 [Steinernema hermaphroditum]|uniref:G-protein coupled receptors family 1 profile domain-containing protein n=1 Tax=Steinernema hermaphroditum TaxID=289476 RepID=A0AA39LVH4_9BILA|nr:hypothetical protein QR680_005770 [Steinernema hermaphroditum]